MNKTLILNSKQIQQKINRIAYEIYENNYDEKEIIVAGIASNGFVLAKHIVEVLQKISPIKTKLIEIVIDKKNKMQSIKLKEINSTLSEFIKIVLKEQ